MRKRARNVVIGLGLAVAGLTVGVLALEREALAMHLALWRARLEGGAVLWPRPGSLRDGRADVESGEIATVDFLQCIADWSGRPIAIDADHRACLESTIHIAVDIEGADSKTVLGFLRTCGIQLSRSPPGDVWFLQHTPSYHQLDWVGE